MPLSRITSPFMSATANVYSPSANTVAIKTAGVDRIIASNTATVGIGTTPSSWGSSFTTLEFPDSSFIANYNNAETFIGSNVYWNGSWKYKRDSGSVPGGAVIDMFSDSTYKAVVQFRVADGGTADGAVTWNYPVNINKYGIGLGSTYPVDGSGIKFSPTQYPSTDANTLDDYEEGTWSPVIKFNGATTGQSYASQVGRYTKIGRLVTVQCYVYFSNKGSATGSATIENLPFTSENASNAYLAVSLWSNNLIFTSGHYLTGYVGPNSSYVALYQVNGGNIYSSLQNSAFGNNTDMMLNCSYVAST